MRVKFLLVGKRLRLQNENFLLILSYIKTEDFLGFLMAG